MKLLLISGHGAGDPGAIGNGKREADETRRVTAALKPILSEYADVTIYPTDRNAYEDYKKGTLAAVAQFSRYDCVLEVHFNALSQSAADGSTKGVECYVPTDTEDTTLPAALCRNLAALGLRNRGVKRKNWSVIHTAHRSGTPAALLEVCFLDDADDMALYTARFNAIVQSMAEAVIDTYHLKKEEEAVTYDTFKEYMDQYLIERAAQQPSEWSADARAWAEEKGIIQGDDKGRKKYKSWPTREEIVEILFRILG